MQASTVHSAGQLAALILTTLILMTQPALAQLVVLLVSFSMALAMGCAMAVGYYYSSRGIEKLSRPHASLLGTLFGGILCYLVLICQASQFIH